MYYDTHAGHYTLNRAGQVGCSATDPRCRNALRRGPVNTAQHAAARRIKVGVEPFRGGLLSEVDAQTHTFEDTHLNAVHASLCLSSPSISCRHRGSASASPDGLVLSRTASATSGVLLAKRGGARQHVQGCGCDRRTVSFARAPSEGRLAQGTMRTRGGSKQPALSPAAAPAARASSAKSK